MMPRDRIDLVGITTKVKGGDPTTPVIDIPPLRATLSVDPQVKGNTNSIEGKMTLFARSLAYSRGTADEMMVWKASIFQDVMLGVGTKGDKFPYLPSSLGGYDKPVPMANRNNLQRALGWWKRGRYRNLINTIISRSFHLVNQVEFERDPFLEKVKSMYEGYSPSYVEYKRDMPILKGKTPKEVAHLMLGEFSNDVGANAALRRLRAARMIVAERDIIVASEVENYLRAMLSTNPSDFKELKEEVETEYRSRTTFSNCFQVLYKDYVEAHIVNRLTPDEISFAMRIDLNSTLKVKNFLFGEKFFEREALDLIYMRGPTKVEFPLLANGRRVFRKDREDVGFEISVEDEAELIKLYKWAKGDKVQLPPRALLEDDDIIFESLLRRMEVEFNRPGILPLVILVTSDKALCRRINEELGLVVVRLPPQLVKAASVGLIEYNPPYAVHGILEGNDMFLPFIQKIKIELPAAFQTNVIMESVIGEIDLGSWVAEIQKLDVFPFSKPTYVSSRTVEYFEYRLPTTDVGTAINGYFARWPLSAEFLFDQEGLTNPSSSSGNPASSSLREVARTKYGSERTKNSYFNVPKNVFRVASKPISKVMSKAESFFRKKTRPLTEDPSPAEQLKFLYDEGVV